MGIGLLPYGGFALCAVVGVVATMVQDRAFVVTLGIETVAMALALAVAQGPAFEWVALGAAVAALSRAVAYGLRRYFAGRE